MRSRSSAARVRGTRGTGERRAGRPPPLRLFDPGRPLGVTASEATEVVAHELRTPLTTLVLGSGILLRRGSAARSGDGIVADLAAATVRLADAVEDLLVLAGVRESVEGAARPEPVSLQHVVRTALEQAAATEPGIRFHAQLPADVPPVLGDDADVRHVVRSLVANGIAGAREGGTVEADLGRISPERIRLRVSGVASRLATPPLRDPKQGVLREAALRVLAKRLGAKLMLAVGPRRVIGEVVMAPEVPRVAGQPLDLAVSP